MRSKIPPEATTGAADSNGDGVPADWADAGEAAPAAAVDTVEVVLLALAQPASSRLAVTSAAPASAVLVNPRRPRGSVNAFKTDETTRGILWL